MQKAAAADRCTKTLTQTNAAEIMWLYYRDNKAQLQRVVGEHREAILTELMQGVAADKVFSRFSLDAEPVPTRLQAKNVARRAR